MLKTSQKKLRAAAVSAVMAVSALGSVFGFSDADSELHVIPVSAEAAGTITIDDLPSEYQFAADWIWNNRIAVEKSTERRNTVFDQIIAGKGTINYVVKWQSYKNVTLEQRRQFETMLSNCYNDWNKWLAGYENWPYEYIDVNIVGWAVIDKNCILDPQEDEIIYTDTRFYDSSYDTSNGYETIPDREPYAPAELSRFEHFTNPNYEYPGGLDKRFDMYMWATEGFPSIGGCGGDWGQRLSDTAYINMLNGSGIHVLEHEIGHGYGMTDFYGGEGAADGFPPGGFPTENGGSLMMAGSSAVITDFDGWMLRYMWTKIKNDNGRFKIEEPVLPTEPTTTQEPTTTTSTTVTTTAINTTTTKTEPVTKPPVVIPDDSEKFTKIDNKNWTFDAKNANVVELTFLGNAMGGGYGALKYPGGETAWEGRLDENGSMLLNIELPEGTGKVTVTNYYAGVWNNDISDMKEIELELVSVKLIYNATEDTTEVTDDTLYGDINLSGNVEISDVVLILGVAAKSESFTLSEQALKNGDVYQPGDGIQASDAASVQKYLLKAISSLPE